MTATAPPGTGTATILVIDDSPVARTALRGMLAAHGFRPVEAVTAADGVRLAASADLIVLDVVLPDRDGLAVCRELKDDPATAAIPIIILTGEAVSDGDRARGLEFGADAYLNKPADPVVVVAQIRALLRVHRAEDAARRAKAAAERGLAQLRAVLSNMTEGVVVASPDGDLLDWNPAALRMHGYGSVEEVRRHLTAFTRTFELRRPGGPPLAYADWPLVRVLRGDRVVEEEIQVRRLDTGLELFVNFNGTPVYGPAGDLQIGIVTLHDITERRRLEGQYRQAQKMEAVGQLAGGIAHDFNNLLTVIVGCGDLLAAAVPPDSPARPFLADLRRAGDRAAGLTRQLLAFSRKSVLAPRVVDPNALIADAERLLARLIGEDVALVLDLQPGVGRVVVDPGLFEQVLMNLAVNARDAMPAGGTLTIATRDAGGSPDRQEASVVVMVADTGVGMSAEVVARVFEPYFTTKGPGKGTGLGLATVHGIVQQAGGHVVVASEPGVGTTFAIYLPRTDAPPGTGSAAGTTAHPPAVPATGTETVLLAEDEDTVRGLARYVLEAAGYTVLEAAHGDDALAAAASHPGPIDLLITDVVMPGMGGRRLAERLTLARPGTRVLYLSGYTDDAVVRHGIEEDRVHFLHKPFTPSALAQTVRAVLDGTA